LPDFGPFRTPLRNPVQSQSDPMLLYRPFCPNLRWLFGEIGTEGTSDAAQQSNVKLGVYILEECLINGFGVAEIAA